MPPETYISLIVGYVLGGIFVFGILMQVFAYDSDKTIKDLVIISIGWPFYFVALFVISFIRAFKVINNESEK